MSEIRYDKLHDTHVIIASERLRRPDPLGVPEEENDPSECPFCSGHEGMTPPEIYAVRPTATAANTPGWQTRVVPNLYKAVQIESPYVHHMGLFEYWEGFGAHEIIIDTPYHSRSMAEWSVSDTFAWLQTLRQRVGDLRRDRRIAYLSLFKNEGTQAGATQPHSHTQLIGLPIVPKGEEERYQRSLHHFLTTRQALMETVLTHEIEAGERLIAQQGEFGAFCPYASAFPFETIISSLHPRGQIDTLSDGDLNDVAVLLRSVVQRLKRQLGGLSFNLGVETPPLHPLVWENGSIDVDAVHRFSIRIMPRVYRYGGFELGTGVVINPVAPELAAKLLREGKNV